MDNMNTMRASKPVTAVLIGLLSVVGLVAQTTTTKKPKAVAKIAESKEHAAIRTQYDAKIKECEQRWLDAKATAESDLELVKTSESSVAKSEAELRLAKLKLGVTVYDMLKDAPGVACKVHPDGEMSDELDTLQNQLKYVDSCIATYHKTIDKKNADLTVRESEQVKACQSLDLYPPTK